VKTDEKQEKLGNPGLASAMAFAGPAFAQNGGSLSAAASAKATSTMKSRPA
jgi:hypothetical protein